MAMEIEWKFLVTRLPALPDVEPSHIRQGYFAGPPSPAIRVRIRDGAGTLNIKGARDHEQADGGPLRAHEFEYPLPPGDVEGLYALTTHHVEKRRYVLPSGLEVDVFEGAHEGLVMAELEVESAADAPPDPPPGWEWTDVSQDPAYTNRHLAEDGLPAGAPQAVIGAQ